MMFSTAKLKSLMAGATLLVAVAAPGAAQAKDYNGSSNGGDLLAQVLVEVLGGSAYTRQPVPQKTYRNDGHGDRDARRHGEYQSGYHAQEILPIGKLARQIRRDTGGRVTTAVLSDNGRFYRIEGIGRRGRLVSAKADAYTGEVYGLKRHNRGHRRADAHAYDALPVPKVLRKLRRKGFHGFDRVVLKENRGLYRVRGLNRRGKPVVVKVDAHDGHILKVKRARNYNRPRYARY